MYKTSACVQPVREKKTSGLSIQNPTGTSWKMCQVPSTYIRYIFLFYFFIYHASKQLLILSTVNVRVLWENISSWCLYDRYDSSPCQTFGYLICVVVFQPKFQCMPNRKPFRNVRFSCLWGIFPQTWWFLNCTNRIFYSLILNLFITENVLHFYILHHDL